MSKRSQNTSSNEGSPSAKAKPCLVSRERERRSEEISSQSLGSRADPEYADGRHEVVRATRQLVFTDSNSQNRTLSSESTRALSKSQQEIWARESKTSRKWWEEVFWLQELKETHSFITRMEKYMQCTNHQYMIKNFSVVAEEVGNVRLSLNILNRSIQIKCIDMVNVYKFDVESLHFWSRISSHVRKFSRTQNSRILRVCSILLKSCWENILKKFWMWSAWSVHHFLGRYRY